MKRPASELPSYDKLREFFSEAFHFLFSSASNKEMQKKEMVHQSFLLGETVYEHAAPSEPKVALPEKHYPRCLYIRKKTIGGLTAGDTPNWNATTMLILNHFG